MHKMCNWHITHTPHIQDNGARRKSSIPAVSAVVLCVHGERIAETKVELGTLLTCNDKG